MRKVILPSLAKEQVTYLISQADNIRDKAIIRLLADSGIRLNELINIKPDHIDFETRTIIIWRKGAKQRKAPFTTRTLHLLNEYLSTTNNGRSNIWGMRRRGIQIMLYRLEKRTGLPCSPHTFRRTFASNLHRSGLDVEHIMMAGGWKSPDVVLSYTSSVKFEVGPGPGWIRGVLNLTWLILLSTVAFN